ncbi:MAG: hypothetical protein U5L72_11605 [Bacteroidales bacterium]|nr:hypothetical protein [Bacteroidales bacterium]
MKRSLLVILFASFALPLPLSASNRQPSPDSSRYFAYWWHSKEIYDHLPDPRNEIVFLSNSITDGSRMV